MKRKIQHLCSLPQIALNTRMDILLDIRRPADLSSLLLRQRYPLQVNANHVMSNHENKDWDIVSAIVTYLQLYCPLQLPKLLCFTFSMTLLKSLATKSEI
jgi:hypothetical protein